MKRLHLFVLALLALGSTLYFPSCTKDEEETPVLGMEFEYLVNGEAFDTSRVYEINGTAVQFSIANFYVGGITFESEEGKDTEMEGKYLLVTPESGMQEIGTLDAGHQHMLKYFIGVGPAENSQTDADFTGRDSDDPLSIQFPAMHWDWLSGYRFIRVDGKVDTDGDGTPDEALAFHIGTDAFLTNLEFTIHKDVEPGMNHLHFEFDLAKLFEGIDLPQEHETHTGNNLGLANKFKANISKAFAYTHG
ncbi:MAG: hypothetical protein KDC66_16195 [Phaeodactylibacter sp.]|nr:hypothetical protein [Phaeodactylibacter sp.]